MDETIETSFQDARIKGSIWVEAGLVPPPPALVSGESWTRR